MSYIIDRVKLSGLFGSLKNHQLILVRQTLEYRL